MSDRGVVIVGGNGRLRRELMARLERSAAGDGVRVVEGCDDPGLDDALASAQVLVHLERQSCPELDRQAHREHTARLIDAADAAGIDHVVLLSSAAAYGAWADNPVPLTEEHALRPNPGADFALDKVEVERRWATWAEGGEGRGLATMRPALVVGDDAEQWLAVALRAVTRWGIGEGDGPIQFVHVEDVAAALALAVDRRLDGVYNVAPEGWMGGEQVQVLTGTPLRPPVPPPVASALARWCWSRGLGSVAPELVPYATHPWVVASDRLRGEGWQPVHSGAETLVEAYPATPWTRFAAPTRRVVSLGGGAVVSLAPVLVVLVRRRRRRRTRRSPTPTGLVSLREAGSRARLPSSSARRRAPRPPRRGRLARARAR
ncbi:MAG TPA: NAD-dependent epimerase/dehydratase family protein [Acidimicrobiales bacterium]|nr:NAD-dependent epimerase/dehydratase family protein [Acidimicrobiales bacterium]